APTVSLSNPTAGQVFINGVNPVQLVANAQDPEGKIKQVEFYNGTTLLTTVTAAPYSYNWTNIQNGNYTVSAKVIDLEGASATSSSVSFTVKSSNQAPTVSLSNPTAGQVFINGVNPVQLVANAQDPEGRIKQVEFYSGTTRLATVTTAPYSYNWTNIQNGNYSVSAKVIDLEGASATSSSVSFTVKAQETTLPAYTAQMVAPINNSTIELGSQPIVLKTNASTSGRTIQKVEFFNWGFPLVTVTSGNFEFTWSSIEVDNYSIHAKVTDNMGNVFTTTAIKFAVKAPTTSAVPDVSLNINLSQPLNNQTFTLGKEIVKLKADVSSSAAIKSVQFYNWGFPLMAVNSSPFEFNWTKIEVGNYQIYAVVTDNNGKTSTSNTVKFQVNPATSSSTSTSSTTASSATVVMSQPTNNQIFELGKNPVTLKATTSEPVSKVEFFNWYLPLVTVSNERNEFNWTKIEVGEYFVSARITDARGNVIDSAPVRFKVIASNTRTTEDETEDSGSTAPIDEIQISSEKEVTLEEPKDSIVYGIKMGPNPTYSDLNIFLDEYPENMEGKVSVIDLRGVELYQSDFNTDQGTLKLDLNFLKPGIYLVKLNFGNKIVQSKKLIKR
ncbi:MAG TPA: Ig-like domain-containing protein, partial [Algoriphagus sp.]|nr:Ig-like domain-containing protein [Algoriphagus sp.]